VVLTFAGDLMAHTRNQTMADYDDIYRALAPWLLADDVSFVNLETPVDADRAPSDYPCFNAHPDYVEAAVRGGFDVFALANNHSFDFGTSSVEGTLKTLAALQASRGIRSSGLRATKKAPLEPVVLEVRGWKVGFLSLTNVFNFNDDGGRVNWVRLWDVWARTENSEAEADLLAQIPRWRQGVDLLVLGLHDGVEYAAQPTAIQRSLYPKLVAAGVDVLWCSHPHVLQPWTWIDTDRGRRLIFYSMGNFVSRQTSQLGPDDGASPRAARGDGALMRVTARRGPDQAPVLDLEPILTNNLTDPARGTLVVPTETLAQTGPEAWRPYYQKRLEVQNLWAAGENP